jgi:hypothetical protein
MKSLVGLALEGTLPLCVKPVVEIGVYRTMHISHKMYKHPDIEDDKAVRKMSVTVVPQICINDLQGTSDVSISGFCGMHERTVIEFRVEKTRMPMSSV